jgi:hypothetical protein
MPKNVDHSQGLQRQWDGLSRELGTLWSAKSGTRSARCVIVTRQGGWELRLVTGSTVLRSVVHHEQDLLLTEAEAWKMNMQVEGWSLVI